MRDEFNIYLRFVIHVLYIFFVCILSFTNHKTTISVAYQLRDGQRRSVDDDGDRGVDGGPNRDQVLAARALSPRRAEALEAVVVGGPARRPGGARRPRTDVDAVDDLTQRAAVALTAVTEEVVGQDVDAQRVVETGRHRRAARAALQLAVTTAELFQTAARVSVDEVHTAASWTTPTATHLGII